MPAIVTSGLLQLRKRPSPPVRISRLLISIAALAVLAALLLLPPDHAHAQNDPTFTEGGTADRSVAENTAAGVDIGSPVAATDADMGDVLEYSLGGTDASSFDIVATTGQLQTKAALDYETKSSYTVTVTVEDDEDPKRNDTIDITITVTNVDEAGTVTITGTLEGGVELTAAVTDPDGTITSGSLSWQWSSSTASNGTFTDISGATGDKYTSVAADVGMFLKAEATYKDPESTTVDKTAEAVTSSAIAASNAKPTFNDDASTTREVPENSSAGTNVGSPIAATDTDTSPTDTLTYGLKNTGDHSSFTIVSTSGQIQTKTGVTYDFEASKNTYTVTVTVHDGKDAANGNSAVDDDEITVTIDLTNVNEPPAITSTGTDFSAVSFDEIAFDVDTSTLTDEDRELKTYVASDPDAAASLTWSLSGTDEDSFTIDSMGKLSFNNTITPNYEDPDDIADPMMEGADDNIYEIVVEVKDGIADSGNAANAVDDSIESDSHRQRHQRNSHDHNHRHHRRRARKHHRRTHVGCF